MKRAATSTPQRTRRYLIDELEGTWEGAKEYGGESDELLYALEGKAFDFQHLWSSGHFDPPVGNAWRTTGKLHRITGTLIEWVDSNGTCEWVQPSISWKSRMLQSAIKDGKLLAVRLLLEAGAEVNPAVEQTPLHAATFRKDARFAEILIKYGARLEVRNRRRLTPLQQAVLNGFEETARLLLQSGADVNAIDVPRKKPSEWDDGRKTPLMLACGLRPAEGDGDLPARMVRMLLEHGADINVKDNEGDGMSALHYAARARNPKILKLLSDAGIDFGELDGRGRTPIHHLILGTEDTT